MAHHDFISELNTPSSQEGGVASFRNCLDRAFAVTTPTAIICLDWREYVATLSYVQAKGLRVPQDLSLICMSDDHATDWLSPVASHFALPIETLANTLSDWLEDISSYNNFTLKASIRCQWVEGETVAAAPSH